MAKKKAAPAELTEAEVACITAAAGPSGSEAAGIAGDVAGRLELLKLITAGMKVRGYTFFEIIALVQVVLRLIDEVGPQLEAIYAKLKELFGK